MAKKKAETTAENNFVERLYKDIEGKYGKGVLKSGQDSAERPRHIISISPAMDFITSGGIAEGSWVGITGNPKTFKTVTALQICANAQKPENGSRKVFYLNVEGRVGKMHLEGISGLNLNRPHFNMIESSRGNILNSQQYLEIATDIIRGEPGCVLVIDSVSLLCDEKETTNGIGTETRGGGAKLFSQFLRMNANVVPTNDVIVIGITHLISNTSGMGAQYMERAARAWQYQCDYQLRTVKKEEWTAGENVVGAKVTWKCNCSALGRPGLQSDSHVRYNMGIDRVSETLEYATSFNLVRKSGAWIYFDFLKTENEDAPKFQGMESAMKALREKPEWENKLLEEYKKFQETVATAEEDDGEGEGA